MTDVKSMAMDYYPRLWSIERLDALVKAKKLTEAERDEIVAGSAAPDPRAEEG